MARNPRRRVDGSGVVPSGDALEVDRIALSASGAPDRATKPHVTRRADAPRTSEAGNDEGRLGSSPGGLGALLTMETTRGPLGAPLLVEAPIRTRDLELAKGGGMHATGGLRTEAHGAANERRGGGAIRRFARRRRPPTRSRDLDLGRETDPGQARKRLLVRHVATKFEDHGELTAGTPRPPGSRLGFALLV